MDKIIFVDAEPDYYVRMLNLLQDELAEEKQRSPDPVRETLERAFETVFKRIAETGFVSVAGADGKQRIREDDRYETFALGLAFGSWLAMTKGVGQQQKIYDIEKQ